MIVHLMRPLAFPRVPLATPMTLGFTHFFLRPRMILHAHISPNIVAGMMMGEIDVMMKERGEGCRGSLEP